MMKGKIKNIVSIGNRDNASGQIEKITDYLTNAAQQRIEYGQSWKLFAEEVSKMALSQNPQVEESIKIIKQDFEDLGQIHISLGESHIRTAQDILDVHYRYEAMFNRHEEYIKARYHFKTASEKLDKKKGKIQQAISKGTYEKNKEKLDAKVAKAKEEKQAALDDYKEALRVLIDSKERFALFKVRRFTEGWTRYSVASQRAANDEKQLMQKIRSDLQMLKDTTFDNNRITNLEERMSQNIENGSDLN